MTNNQHKRIPEIFQDLRKVNGPQIVDEHFMTWLSNVDSSCYQYLHQGRVTPSDASCPEASQQLIHAARLLEQYLIERFELHKAYAQCQHSLKSVTPIVWFKSEYAKPSRPRLSAEQQDFKALNHALLARLQLESLDELSLATWVMALEQDGAADCADRQLVQAWCQAVWQSDLAIDIRTHWISFQLPKRVDPQQLVATRSTNDSDKVQTSHTWASRDGFNYTSVLNSSAQLVAEADYCLKCHVKQTDYCRSGFLNKKKDVSAGFRENALGNELHGCPLDEKISEMNLLYSEAHLIAALAVIMVDNPMCPATGYRICNDCMKACIYQKQQPVDVPQLESDILDRVLSLPWGVEIYDCLTRWNPLRCQQPAAKPYNGKKVCIIGMGPAGFTMAHHLLMEGCAVVAVDGLKLEPLPQKDFLQPVYDFAQWSDQLSERMIVGFGGVAEYGITARWNKNLLKLIYLSLRRHAYFACFGSVRFGGTITCDSIWSLGFDHCVLAVGAGLPKELRIPNSLAPGMRQANDFLMALQLTGAVKQDSLVNVQVDLPAVVIGGGLTGVDAATELQAYYIHQAEKTLDRYELLCDQHSQQWLQQQFSVDDWQRILRWCAHGRAIRQERRQARQQQRACHWPPLLQQWGGVSIVYRKAMNQSPAYRNNHDELDHALREGVLYQAHCEPVRVVCDEHGWVSALNCVDTRSCDLQVHQCPDEVVIPARCILVATGATPNIAYQFEHQDSIKRDGRYYSGYQQSDDGELKKVSHQASVKDHSLGILTSYARDHHRISFIGDMHPVFHGSVVKAIASAKYAYPQVIDVMGPGDAKPEDPNEFMALIADQCQARVVSVTRHRADVVECRIRAPLAASRHQAGQFYRLQSYEMNAPILGQTALHTEALALLGCPVDDDPTVLSFFIIERGASSAMVSCFQVGQQVALMGPTGVRFKQPKRAKSQLWVIGGDLAIPFVLSVAPSWQRAGCDVHFFALLDDQRPLFADKSLESLATIHRLPRQGFMQQISEMTALCWQACEQVAVIGDGALLRDVRNHPIWARQLPDSAQMSGSVYGPMQCALKGVCAQCLQWQIDPHSGERSKAVYACSWQQQPLEKIEIDNIFERSVQNRAQERLSQLYLDYLLDQYPVDRV